MIAGTVALVALTAGQDIIHSDISGSRRWRVALESPRAAVAFLQTAEDGDAREVVLMTTAWVVEAPGAQPGLHQRFFVHVLNCADRTEAQTGFGLTDPPPRRWTPEDGPPPSRAVHAPEPIDPSSPMAVIAEAVCGNEGPTLPEIAGDWVAVATALRRRLEAAGASTGTGD